MKKTVIPILLFAFLIFAAAGNRQKSASEEFRVMKSPTVIPGEVCVKFKKSVKISLVADGPALTGLVSLDEKIARFGVMKIEKRFRHRPVAEDSGLPDLSRIFRLTFTEGFNPEDVARIFAEDPNVEYAEPVYVLQLDAVPNDPMYAQQFHLPQIMAEEAWDIHQGQAGAEQVVIAIIDGGTDWRHTDLRQNTWQNLGEDADGDGFTIVSENLQWVLDPGDLNGIDDDMNGFVDDLIGWDFHEFATTGNGSNPDPTWGSPTQDHGTHVAGIAAGRTDNNSGIASISWNVKYMPVQADAANNTLYYGYDGIIYAAENGAGVINCSWGSSAFSQAGMEAVEYAQGLGAIMVCSAGNQNSETVRYPSGYPGVISVASVNSADQKASYSSFGPAVDISTPGGDWDGSILSTFPNNSYSSLDGTSMASPLAAGLTGLIRSYHPEWTREQVMQQLIGSCDNIDTLNPGFEFCLGDGRINAFRALTDPNATPLQVLKITIDATAHDLDGDGNIAGGDNGLFNIRLWNHSAFTGSSNAQISLITEDPDIQIINGTLPVNIPPDDFIQLDNIFLFEVSETCQPHFALFKICVSADIPVALGDTIPVTVMVANDGIFVFEPETGHFDYSGSYIKMFLENIDQQVLYSTVYPSSFTGFDAVFLSYGNFGEQLTEGLVMNYPMSQAIQDYLERGGNVYAEMSGFIQGANFLGFPNAQELMDLFGVGSYVLMLVENPIEILTGNPGTPYEGMEFTESGQHINWYIDNLTALPGAYCTFYENDYGNVGIENSGQYGQKTSYFGYALAELEDVDAESSRYNILLQVMKFFGYEPEPGYVIANFTSDARTGGPGVEVQFQDLSLTGEGYTVNEWHWDFENDGIIDSQEQNPVYVFQEAGTFDVRLVASNGTVSDTLIYPGFIHINSGIFVFEGFAGERNLSGTYIRDFLEENSLDVTYSGELFPETLDGFDAVFLSLGNFLGGYTPFNNDMAGIVLEYLQGGGQVYLEGGDALGFDQATNQDLFDLFGLEGVEDGTTNSIDMLQGLSGSIVEGLSYAGSNQTVSSYIDIYVPGAGTAAFEESGYGIVGVQNEAAGPGLPHKTFCFSYALAELQDGEMPNTREELMWRILGFFGLITGVNENENASDEIEMQVWPNPFKGEAMVSFYNHNSRREASLQICDLAGRAVASMEITNLAGGRNQVSVNIPELPAGIYVVKLEIGGMTAGRKVVIK